MGSSYTPHRAEREPETGPAISPFPRAPLPFRATAPSTSNDQLQVRNIDTVPGTYNSSIPQISSPWVYVKIIEGNANQIFYAYNVYTEMSRRFPRLPGGLMNSATTFLNGQLYVIGGSEYNGMPSKSVYMCDPVDLIWDQLPSTWTARKNAVAAAAIGRVYVFGGCRHRSPVIVPWAEVYDPHTFQWTAIFESPPRDLFFSLSRRPLHAVVFGDKIFIRNDCTGVAYNVIFSSWDRIPEVICNYWMKWSSAVVVGGMFVAYHQQRNGEVSVRAYDPGQALWLPLDFVKPAFPILGEMVNFLSVNGKLVAYHMGEWPLPLTFTVMQMQMNSTRTRITVETGNSVAYRPTSRDWDFEGPGHAANP